MIYQALELHKLWVEIKKGGVRADLRGANLQKADLRWADLREAELDFSCWPLWCGSLGVKVNKRIAVQLAYHFCALDCGDKEYKKVRLCILEFANKMHRKDVARLK
jgi:uncharacterized protein YjbI with pentapeptide repeats